MAAAAAPTTTTTAAAKGKAKATLPAAPNDMVQIVDEIHERVARLFYAGEGELLAKIDRIPVEMRPKTFGRPSRCCVYRDRAMIRYRILAILGMRIEDEDDETRSLASYAETALRRAPKQIALPVLTVLEEACNRCTRQQYLVTDACQNCIAKPCKTACPRGAIDHKTGKARIDPERCIRCGRCMQACPYHAIIDIPIPCIKACPVGAITPLPDGRKHFDFAKCIYCGSCQRACPFGAVMIRSQMIDVLRVLQKCSPAAVEAAAAAAAAETAAPKKVVALIAPSIVGHFGTGFTLPCIVAVIKRLGFSEVLEVALGADTTAIEEGREFDHRMALAAEGKGRPFMTTSCCPAYIRAIREHVPDIEDAVSLTPTPMAYTAKMAKERFPGCLTVFVGPCDAKLAEAMDCPDTDFALTFTELIAMLRARNLDLDSIKDSEAAEAAGSAVASAQGRGFAVTGGVSAAVAAFARTPVRPVIIDGLNPASIKKLRSFGKHPPPGNLIEVMTCPGGCVGGPGASVAVNIAAARVRQVTTKTAAHPNAAKVAVKPVIIRGDQVIGLDD